MNTLHEKTGLKWQPTKATIETVSYITPKKKFQQIEARRERQTSILMSPDVVMEAVHCGSTSIVLEKQTHTS